MQTSIYRNPAQLPTELFGMVMGNLCSRDLFFARSVSRTWRQILSNDHTIWTHMDNSFFARLQRTPEAMCLIRTAKHKVVSVRLKGKYISSRLSKLDQVRSMGNLDAVLAKCLNLQELAYSTKYRLSRIPNPPNLRKLEILCDGPLPRFALNLAPFTNLEDLTIDRFETCVHGNPVLSFPSWAGISSKLKRLSFSFDPYNINHRGRYDLSGLNIGLLATAAPDMEVLNLYYIEINPQDGGRNKIDRFEKLRECTLECLSYPRAVPFLPTSLEKLVLRYKGETFGDGAFWTLNNGMWSSWTLEQLADVIPHLPNLKELDTNLDGNVSNEGEHQPDKRLWSHIIKNSGCMLRKLRAETHSNPGCSEAGAGWNVVEDWVLDLLDSIGNDGGLAELEELEIFSYAERDRHAATIRMLLDKCKDLRALKWRGEVLLDKDLVDELLAKLGHRVTLALMIGPVEDFRGKCRRGWRCRCSEMVDVEDSD